MNLRLRQWKLESKDRRQQGGRRVVPDWQIFRTKLVPNSIVQAGSDSTWESASHLGGAQCLQADAGWAGWASATAWFPGSTRHVSGACAIAAHASVEEGKADADEIAVSTL